MSIARVVVKQSRTVGGVQILEDVLRPLTGHLARKIGPADTTLYLREPTWFRWGDIVKIEDELIHLLTDGPEGTGLFEIARAYGGSTAAEHRAGRKVTILGHVPPKR